MQKYKKFPSHVFEGYVVNIFDNLNYDIHLKATNEEDNLVLQRYSKVIKEKFSYIDIDNDNILNTINYDESKGIIVYDREKIKTSDCYRCRLKNISSISEEGNKTSQIVNDVVNFNNGWVKVIVSDIDIYNRILCEIYDEETEKSITNLLIEKYPHKYHEYTQE